MPSQQSLLGAPQAGFMNNQRVQSMAGLSMWGGGSQYDSPQFIQPQMTGMSGHSPHPAMPMNPFDSPMTMPLDGNGRQSGYYPQYPTVPNMGMGMGAPRGSVMTNLGGYGMMPTPPQGQVQMPRGVSTYSLATTTNHPLAPPPQINQGSNPDDEEVVGVLRRHLATQDLMSV
jgi:chitin synthase